MFKKKVKIIFLTDHIYHDIYSANKKERNTLIDLQSIKSRYISILHQQIYFTARNFKKIDDFTLLATFVIEHISNIFCFIYM